MNDRLGVRAILSLVLFAALALSPGARAQGSSQQLEGIDLGGYNIHQTIEFGYRSSNINGNMNTYNTFENLGSGVRLFDFDFSMRSIDHHALLSLIHISQV